MGQDCPSSGWQVTPDLWGGAEQPWDLSPREQMCPVWLRTMCLRKQVVFPFSEGNAASFQGGGILQGMPSVHEEAEGNHNCSRTGPDHCAGQQPCWAGTGTACFRATLNTCPGAAGGAAWEGLSSLCRWPGCPPGSWGAPSF